LKNILENRIHVVKNVETPPRLPSFTRLKFNSSSIACGFRTLGPQHRIGKLSLKIKINYFHSQIRQQTAKHLLCAIIIINTDDTVNNRLVFVRFF
jgi:hypothetical protein